MSEDAAEPKAKRPSWWRLLRWILAAPILLVFLLMLSAETWLFETLLKLGAGWWFFLQRNVVSMHFSPERILTSLAVLAFAVAGLHLLARAWRRHVRPQTPAWRLRWSLGISGLALLLACAAMAVAGLAHQIAWMSGQPLLQTNMSQMRAASQARQVGMIIRFYAEEHDDLCPPNLENLIHWSNQEEATDWSKLRFYQADPRHTPEPWLYFGVGQRITENSNRLLLAAPRPTSRGKRLIVTMDLTTSFEPESHFQKQLAEWKASSKAPNPPGQ